MIRTGQEYRESIRDGREIYINGEKVEDVTTHPMFKPLLDIRARIYDMAHQADKQHVMSYEEEGERHAIGNKLPYSQEDWWKKRRATDTVMEDVGGILCRKFMT